MAKFARIYDFRLTAGGSFPLLVEGEYVRVMSSTGPIEIQADNYDLGPLSAGQGMEGSDFRRLLIVDKSGSPNIGTVLVASSGFIDQRINGEVSVIDGGKARTRAGNAYLGYVLRGAGASNAHVQLWNPVGSGRVFVVEKVTSGVDAGNVNFGFYNAKLTTAYGVGKNKLSGGADSVGELATLDSGPGFTVIGGFTPPVGVSLVYPLSEPLVVVPGQGLVFVANTSAKGISVLFEYFEEAL